jgi:hypothetical protein
MYPKHPKYVVMLISSRWLTRRVKKECRRLPKTIKIGRKMKMITMIVFNTRVCL